MCFILATSEFRRGYIPLLQDAWAVNHDGAGIAVFERGKTQMNKPYMSMKHLRARLNNIVGKPAIVHLRMATHGSVNGSNCHPFWTLKHQALMAHNGIMPKPWSMSQQQSDSRCFADSMMDIDPDMSPQQRVELEKAIGTYNKVAIMRPDGSIFVMNRQAGHEYDSGTWCSCNPASFHWKVNYQAARPRQQVMLLNEGDENLYQRWLREKSLDREPAYNAYADYYGRILE